jgi:hypothetical protein
LITLAQWVYTSTHYTHVSGPPNSEVVGSPITGNHGKSLGMSDVAEYVDKFPIQSMKSKRAFVRIIGLELLIIQNHNVIVFAAIIIL